MLSKVILVSGCIMAVFVLCLALGSAASGPDIEWQKCLGGSSYEDARDTQQTSDGGYIVGGFTSSNDGNVSGNHGSGDFWVVKLDTSGNIVWQKCLGGSLGEFLGNVRQTSDGGYIVAGSTSSNDGNVSGNHGSGDFWVVKLDTSGNIVWQKCLGGSSGDGSESVRQTSDGGYIAVGYTSSNDGNVSGNHGAIDFWVVKLDTGGNIVWQKCLGGSSNDYGESVQQTSDGGYIVAGSTYSNNGDVSGNHGTDDFWVVKLDTSGNLVWQKCLGGSLRDYAESIQQTSDGGYIVAGPTYSNNGDVSGNHGSADFWVVKLDTSGNLVWQKCLGGSSFEEDWGVQQTLDGGYIVAGAASSNDGNVTGNHGSADFWVVKLDTSGNMVWQKCLGGSLSDPAYGVQQTSDEGYIVAGAASSNDGNVTGNHGSFDFWVVKLQGTEESQNYDLSVSKIALVNGIPVLQVNPGQTFNYNITVTNKDLINDASLVVVTDKLPYEAEYIDAEVYPALPEDYTINRSGDLVYIRFDQIPAGSIRYINITVKAPGQAPTTLYNTVNLRYRYDQNTSDNRATITTYVPQTGYNQTEAAKSFEDLLHNQSQLLFQFEDLLHTIPSNNSTNYTFLVSFEQLLRSQAALTGSFEDLLTNESSTGWDTEYTEENRTALLWSYEQMLYDEAFLFASFNMKIDESWMSLCSYTAEGHSQDAQTELIASFEDLLKRQTRLYKSFNLLLNKIDIASHQNLINLLAAYENLLRVEANLLMSFNELLETKYENSICP